MGDIHEALLAKGFHGLRIQTCLTDRMICRVGAVAGQKFRQKLRQKDLAQIGNTLRAECLKSADNSDFASAAAADVGSDGQVTELLQQILRLHLMGAGKGGQPLRAAAGVDGDAADVRAVQIVGQGPTVVIKLGQLLPEG